MKSTDHLPFRGHKHAVAKTPSVFRMRRSTQHGEDTTIQRSVHAERAGSAGLALEPILDPNAPTRALTLDDAEDGRPRQICTRHCPGTSPRGGSEGPKTRLMTPRQLPRPGRPHRRSAIRGQPSGSLCAFVRDSTRTETGEGPPATEIQAALTVIGRHTAMGTALPDLNHAHIPRADLRNANLRDAYLLADQRGATVAQAQLDQACGSNVKLDPGLTLNKPCP
jgi:hypothetical protein